ncbi:MAG: tetratricopeptide repeat protein [candidate division KSB1 bacterium]|nr:tetratricopeptide repeat protein [candidate division KSB1 bacterium]
MQDYIDKLTNVCSLMDAHDYEKAEPFLEQLVGDNPDEQRLDAVTLLARCQLALEQFKDALYNYQFIAEQDNPVYLQNQGEAALVSGAAGTGIPLFPGCSRTGAQAGLLYAVRCNRI